MDNIVWAIMLWVMEGGALMGAFEEIPEGYVACVDYITVVIDAAAENGKALTGKCTYDIDELARLIGETK